jgi:nucleotide-binding universal stress UspA family protein
LRKGGSAAATVEGRDRQFLSAGFRGEGRGRGVRLHRGAGAREVSSNIGASCHVAQGTVYEEILATARDVRADFIVMASHRPELTDYLLGPNAARMVRHSEVSVVVVRN